MLALLGWRLGHGTALQPWPSTLTIPISPSLLSWRYSLTTLDQMTHGIHGKTVILPAPSDTVCLHRDVLGTKDCQHTTQRQSSHALKSCYLLVQYTLHTQADKLAL